MRAHYKLSGPGGKAQQLECRPRYVASDLRTLKFAALRGVGICALPDYMCRDELRQRTLLPVLPGWSLPQGIFHAVFPSRRGLIPAVRVFPDFLCEAIMAEGWAASQPG